jgi:hypothetical protein
MIHHDRDTQMAIQNRCFVLLIEDTTCYPQCTVKSITDGAYWFMSKNYNKPTQLCLRTSPGQNNN